MVRPSANLLNKTITITPRTKGEGSMGGETFTDGTTRQLRGRVQPMDPDANEDFNRDLFDEVAKFYFADDPAVDENATLTVDTFVYEVLSWKDTDLLGELYVVIAARKRRQE